MDPLAALNTQPDSANPYLSSGRPDLDRRPAALASDGAAYQEPGSFDSGKAMMIGGGVLAVLVVAWILSQAIVLPIPAPKEFSQYSTASNAFSLDAPTDWSHKAMDTHREDSMTGQQYEADDDGVTFWKGKATVEVDSSSGGRSAEQNLLSGGGPTATTVEETENKSFLDRMKKRVGGFTPSDATGISLPGFDARVTEYTGTTGFLGLGGKIHGYAATVQGPKHILTMYLECPEKSWDDLKPAFQRMMLSVRLDGKSGADIVRDLQSGGFGGAPGGGGITLPGGQNIQIPGGVGGP